MGSFQVHKSQQTAAGGRDNLNEKRAPAATSTAAHTATGITSSSPVVRNRRSSTASPALRRALADRTDTIRVFALNEVNILPMPHKAASLLIPNQYMSNITDENYFSNKFDFSENNCLNKKEIQSWPVKVKRKSCEGIATVDCDIVVEDEVDMNQERMDGYEEQGQIAAEEETENPTPGLDGNASELGLDFLSDSVLEEGLGVHKILTHVPSLLNATSSDVHDVGNPQKRFRGDGNSSFIVNIPVQPRRKSAVTSAAVTSAIANVLPLLSSAQKSGKRRLQNNGRRARGGTSDIRSEAIQSLQASTRTLSSDVVAGTDGGAQREQDSLPGRTRAARLRSSAILTRSEGVDTKADDSARANANTSYVSSDVSAERTESKRSSGRIIAKKFNLRDL